MKALSFVREAHRFGAIRRSSSKTLKRTIVNSWEQAWNTHDMDAIASAGLFTRSSA
jgi:hypothetical protein